jgi:hypothetical protein
MNKRPRLQLSIDQVKYWYVKARNIQTGQEVQRLSRAGGARTAQAAALDMDRYLRRTGRATRDDATWETVEVFGWPQWPAHSPRPGSPITERPLSLVNGIPILHERSRILQKESQRVSQSVFALLARSKRLTAASHRIRERVGGPRTVLGSTPQAPDREG